MIQIETISLKKPAIVFVASFSIGILSIGSIIRKS